MMTTINPGPGHDEGFEQLSVGWALHALEPEDADAFRPHLAACPRCREIVDQTVEVMADLASSAPAVEPPAGLGDRLRAEVARTPQDGSDEADTVVPPVPVAVPPAAVPSLPPAAVPVPRRRWTSVLVAASLAAVVGLGAWSVALVGDRNEARDLAAAESSMVDEMLRPGPAMVVPLTGDGRTVATLLARDDGMQVVSRALAANDREAETYVLWGLDQGTPKALGTFDVDGTGPELDTLEVEGADDFPSYGISIEPGRQAPDTPTDVVARS